MINTIIRKREQQLKQLDIHFERALVLPLKLQALISDYGVDISYKEDEELSDDNVIEKSDQESDHWLSDDRSFGDSLLSSEEEKTNSFLSLHENLFGNKARSNQKEPELE